ncbi:MAG: hypothetical protein NC393_04510 [Clostridium sp.]|nr:hypothetical protein [Clostridium sp.]MCM1171373.1 hypothetical protein [Clostridium sp.]MCM1207742.1 hypothetical protein [Ruminococcus sp.]
MKIRMSAGKQDRERFIKGIINKYHFEPEAENDIISVYEKMQSCMKPYAVYRMNQRDTGIKDIDSRQSAIVAMTLGKEIDSLEEQLTAAGKLDEAYMLECIAAELLLTMYGDFNKEYAKFHRRYVERYVFIGEEIPVTEVPRLLKEVKGAKNTCVYLEKENGQGTKDLDEETEYDKAGQDKKEYENMEQEKTIECEDDITANEYGVLTPSKSVVFYAILTENPKQVCEGICSTCENVNCENRIKDCQMVI